MMFTFDSIKNRFIPTGLVRSSNITANEKLQIEEIKVNYLNNPHRHALLRQREYIMTSSSWPYAVIDKKGNLIECGSKIDSQIAIEILQSIDKQLDDMAKDVQDRINLIAH